MALTRGSIIGYNSDRMMFEFTMKARDEKVVACQISSVAMDMDGDAVLRPWSVKRSSLNFRDAIEKIAGDIFKVEGAVHAGIVRIFEKHLPDGRARKAIG